MAASEREGTAGSASGRGALPAVVRWLLVPVATLGGWMAGLTVAVAAGEVIHGLLAATSLDGWIGPEYRLAFVAAVAAMGWSAGALAAPPPRRWIAAAVTFGIGTCVAMLLLGWWYFPEDHPRAYQTSLVPVMGAWLGGPACWPRWSSA